jgi:multidrug efflux pump subunit AcrA (membrane-fusion protein)
VLLAQIDQVSAELALVEDRLGHTRVAAPFPGIVVTGDLSQQLGAPVARGDLLFEIAPLEAYRVVLRVDERDIDEIATEQSGELALFALPDESFPFSVEKITPVSEPAEGHNRFRVEARLEAPPPLQLRPGMEGVAKVEVGRRRLIWIWTHEAVDWLRLGLWSFLP